MKTNLQKAQDFALGQCLSEYPSSASYDEIVAWYIEDRRYYDGTPKVTAWEPLEDCDVIHIMDNMVSAVTRLLDAQEVTA